MILRIILCIYDIKLDYNFEMINLESKIMIAYGQMNKQYIKITQFSKIKCIIRILLGNIKNQFKKN